MDADVEARFWSKVDMSGGTDVCWRWMGAMLKTGYGGVKIGGVSQRAHRVAFELAGNEIPVGMMVLHSCDNPLCCNPAHLRVGSAADNTADARERGRIPKAAPRPAPTRTHRRRVPQPARVEDLPDDLLSTAEAADVMGVTDAHVRRVIGSGELAARRFGERAWMVRRGDAEDWKRVQRKTGPKRGAVAMAASRDPRFDMEYDFERDGQPAAQVVGVRAMIESRETMTVGDGPEDLSGGMLTSTATGKRYRVVGPLGQTTYSTGDDGGAGRVWIIERA